MVVLANSGQRRRLNLGFGEGDAGAWPLFMGLAWLGAHAKASNRGEEGFLGSVRIDDER